MIRIVVPKEIWPHETRVAIIPEIVGKLKQAGFAVVVESGAGVASHHTDEAYREAGAEINGNLDTLYAASNVILKVRPPREHPETGRHEIQMYPEGSILIGLLEASARSELVEQLVARRINAFSLEHLPRVSRAQKMDVLSSMSTIAGYKAALLCADSLPKFFPLMMTAAGTIAPAKIHIVGAGVAGLTAIATARRLGAVVEASDIRPAVREEVQSLGASFVDLKLTETEAVGSGGYARELSESRQEQERAILTERVRQMDGVICTAMVPGKRAPRLITREMVEQMRPGSVIVDLAAEQGGNCELTKPEGSIIHHGVVIHGPVHLVSAVPKDASRMFARNVYAFLNHLIQNGRIQLDFEDEILSATCVTRGSTERLGPSSTSPPTTTTSPAPARSGEKG